ncbi:TPA: hypothetical protein ACYBJV_000388, partial [Neisseria meningitidis]
GGIWVKLGGIWGENSRKPVLGFRLSGGKGVLQRSQLVPDPQGQGGVWRVFILPENANAV